MVRGVECGEAAVEGGEDGGHDKEEVDGECVMRAEEGEEGVCA